MKSKISFCNRTLLRKNITRFTPLWALFLFSVLVALPVMLLVQTSYYYYDSFGPVSVAGLHTESIVDYLSESVPIVGIVLNIIYGFLCAAACFGYLHRRRSAYMLHAFPVTRAELLRTNLLSGLLFAAVPYLTAIWLCLLVTAVKGAVCAATLSSLLTCFVTLMLQFITFYALAVFSMLLSGKTFFALLVYAGLNVAPLIFELLTRYIVEPMIYGYQWTGNMLTFYFTPTWYFITQEHASHPTLFALIAALVACGFLVLAWVLYRRRHLEATGEGIAYPAARPVFKYLFAHLCALCLGCLLWIIIGGDSSAIRQALPILIVCLTVAGFIGYFGAEMMLRRTVRVFQGRAFLGFAVYTVLLVTMLLLVRFDVFGVARYVPDTGSLRECTVERGPEITLTDAADIERITALHRTLTEDWNRNTETQSVNGYLYLTYTLKNGATVERRYPYSYADTETLTLMKELYSRPDIVLRYLDDICFFDASEVTVNFHSDSVALRSTSLEALKEAVRQDIAAGNFLLGNRMIDKSVSYDCSFEYQLSTKDGDVCWQYLPVPGTAENTIRYLNNIKYSIS